MRRIPLSQGKHALVDDEDYESVVAIGNWHAQRSKWGYYANHNIMHGGRSRGMLKMHQVILGVSGVDHIDHDGLNNQRSNLRPATAAQNAANRRLRFDNAVGYKGVHYEPNPRLRTGGRFVVQVRSADEYFRKRCRTALEAALLYDIHAKRIFGAFACLNFPEGSTATATGHSTVALARR